MRRLVVVALLALFLFPLTVAAKGGSGGGDGGFSSGARSAPSMSSSNSRPSGGFTSGVQRPAGTTPRQAVQAQRAQERLYTPPAPAPTPAASTTVINNNGGGGGGWFLPAMLGYVAGGGCDRRDRDAKQGG